MKQWIFMMGLLALSLGCGQEFEDSQDQDPPLEGIGQSVAPISRLWLEERTGWAKIQPNANEETQVFRQEEGGWQITQPIWVDRKATELKEISQSPGLRFEVMEGEALKSLHLSFYFQSQRFGEVLGGHRIEAIRQGQSYFIPFNIHFLGLALSGVKPSEMVWFHLELEWGDGQKRDCYIRFHLQQEPPEVLISGQELSIKDYREEQRARHFSGDLSFYEWQINNPTNATIKAELDFSSVVDLKQGVFKTWHYAEGNRSRRRVHKTEGTDAWHTAPGLRIDLYRGEQRIRSLAVSSQLRAQQIDVDIDPNETISARVVAEMGRMKRCSMPADYSEALSQDCRDSGRGNIGMPGDILPPVTCTDVYYPATHKDLGARFEYRFLVSGLVRYRSQNPEDELLRTEIPEKGHWSAKGKQVPNRTQKFLNCYGLLV